MSKMDYPDHRPGFRYRRALGESLSRALTRFSNDHGGTGVGKMLVSFHTRDGRALVELSLATAVHVIQFNEHIFNGTNLEEACEATIKEVV